MGIMRRLAELFRVRANRALDQAEDPRLTLDDSYERQLELLQRVRRGLAEVATARKRLELQGQQLQQSGTKLEGQARQALGQGREDLAREALARQASIAAELNELGAQHAQLNGEEGRLTEAARRLQAKVDAFRVRKETIKATYTAAEAQTRIGEAMAGISEEMGDVGLAVRRAEDKTAQLRARAGAIDELLTSGALDDLSQPTDRIQAELDRVSIGSSVDARLTELKAELGTEQRQALGGPAEGGQS